MRALVLGAAGMLGRVISARAKERGWEVDAPGRADADVTDAAQLRRHFANAPDVVFNTAAYTAVDRAESEPELAARVNRDGAAIVARLAGEHGVPLVHLSTDYVFDGRATRPYRPEDPTSPLCVYGATKLEGEECVRSSADRHLIVRTSWLFASQGSNFVRTMLKLAGERDELRVVEDQRGSPTYADDLASALLDAVEQTRGRAGLWGTYHFANEGETSWYRFADAILRLAAPSMALRAQRVVPIRTADFPRPAKRPAYSVLDCTSFAETFGICRRPWTEALAEMLEMLAASASGPAARA